MVDTKKLYKRYFSILFSINNGLVGEEALSSIRTFKRLWNEAKENVSINDFYDWIFQESDLKNKEDQIQQFFDDRYEFINLHFVEFSDGIKAYFSQKETEKRETKNISILNDACAIRRKYEKMQTAGNIQTASVLIKEYERILSENSIRPLDADKYHLERTQALISIFEKLLIMDAVTSKESDEKYTSEAKVIASKYGFINKEYLDSNEVGLAPNDELLEEYELFMLDNNAYYEAFKLLKSSLQKNTPAASNQTNMDGGAGFNPEPEIQNFTLHSMRNASGAILTPYMGMNYSDAFHRYWTDQKDLISASIDDELSNISLNATEINIVQYATIVGGNISATQINWDSLKQTRLLDLKLQSQSAKIKFEEIEDSNIQIKTGVIQVEESNHLSLLLEDSVTFTSHKTAKNMTLVLSGSSKAVFKSDLEDSMISGKNNTTVEFQGTAKAIRTTFRGAIPNLDIENVHDYKFSDEALYFLPRVERFFRESLTMGKPFISPSGTPMKAGWQPKSIKLNENEKHFISTLVAAYGHGYSGGIFSASQFSAQKWEEFYDPKKQYRLYVIPYLQEGEGVMDSYKNDVPDKFNYKILILKDNDLDLLHLKGKAFAKNDDLDKNYWNYLVHGIEHFQFNISCSNNNHMPIAFGKLEIDSNDQSISLEEDIIRIKKAENKGLFENIEYNSLLINGTDRKYYPRTSYREPRENKENEFSKGYLSGVAGVQSKISKPYFLIDSNLTEACTFSYDANYIVSDTPRTKFVGTSKELILIGNLAFGGYLNTTSEIFLAGDTDLSQSEFSGTDTKFFLLSGKRSPYLSQKIKEIKQDPDTLKLSLSEADIKSSKLIIAIGTQGNVFCHKIKASDSEIVIANLNKVDFEGSSFKSSKIIIENVKVVNLTNCKFENGSISIGKNVEKVIIDGAEMAGTGVDCDTAILSAIKAKILGQTKIRGIIGASDFSGAQLGTDIRQGHQRLEFLLNSKTQNLTSARLGNISIESETFDMLHTDWAQVTVVGEIRTAERHAEGIVRAFDSVANLKKLDSGLESKKISGRTFDLTS